jgi:hypothetical protein
MAKKINNTVRIDPDRFKRLSDYRDVLGVSVEQALREE